MRAESQHKNSTSYAWNFARFLAQLRGKWSISLRVQSPYTGVSTPPSGRAPKSPKSLKKDFPGLPAQSVKKVSKKSPNTDFVVFLTLFWVIWDFFDTFFDTPGQEAREPPFETFWGFWAQTASGLLYMAAPIATISYAWIFPPC